MKGRIGRRRADDAQIGKPIEHRRERLAHEAIVVDDRNRDRVAWRHKAIVFANPGGAGSARQQSTRTMGAESSLTNYVR